MVEIGSDSELAKNQKQTAQTVKEFLQVIDDYQSKTNFYIRHLLRTNHEDPVKATVLEKLTECQVLKIIDWKMKFEPNKFREAMVEYFGKSGITWHGTYIIFKQNGQFITKFYNDVGDDKQEDGYSVFSSIVETSKQIKSEFPHLTECFLVTDGAGCYSCAYLAINLAVVGQLTGLHILEHFVAEAGRGKSCLDANFGVNMQHQRKITKAGEQDVAFASDLCAALGARGGVKANSYKEIVIDAAVSSTLAKIFSQA